MSIQHSVTIKDIAKKLKLSPSTVSRALLGDGKKFRHGNVRDLVKSFLDKMFCGLKSSEIIIYHHFVSLYLIIYPIEHNKRNTLFHKTGKVVVFIRFIRQADNQSINPS